ncbi:MAG: flagellar hook assembly protein FlgD, partial [Rhodobacteraceae bacterium]|nr:flagellar hook assembly protein FlgD [Paracoccaceae bacterium]
QLQNQDPLNPLDSTDFAMQLATFSGVEQQVQTNSLISGLSSQLGMMNLAQLSGWIGKEARTTQDVHFDGSPITVFPSPATGADSAALVVRDPSGAVLARETLPLSAAPYQWLGGDAAGNPLPAGRYRLSVESSRGDDVIATTSVASFAPIQEARRNGNSIILVLKGGIEVAEKDILALRDG